MNKPFGLALGTLLATFFVLGSAQLRTIPAPFPLYPGDERLNQLEITEDQAFFDARGNRLIIIRKPAAGGPRKGGKLETIAIDLAKRISPSVSVDLRRESSGRWLYRYTVGNETSASRSIESWRLDIPEPRSPDPLNPQDVPYPIERLGTWVAGHFGYLPGRWAMRWSRKPNQPALTPGAKTLDFLLEGDRRPGILRAYFQSRTQPRQIPGDLSLELQRRLQSFLFGGGDGVTVWTLGPKFDKDEDPRVIAADFQVGIRRLSRQGQLEEGSPFVRDCLEYLRSLVDGTAPDDAGLPPDFQTTARTPLERSVSQALRLALE